MTRRLILMRHAKSDWDDPVLRDIERPLSERGRVNATALGDWLRSRGYLPDAVLCSSATRTAETFVGLALECPVRYLPELYHAPPATLLTALRQAEGQTVILLAHNPGIGDFAQDIVQSPPDHHRFGDYPTGATLVCDLPVNDWTDAQLRSAQVVDFIVPRDL